MTTTVKIDAHCDPKTTKVRIIVGKKSTPLKQDNKDKVISFLEDGESSEHVVHDDIYITADEVPKA